MSNIKIQDLPFMLGSDPELVIFDRKLDRIIPSNGLVKGTKDKPYRLTNGTVQLDGTATEIGPDAGRTAKEFLHNIKSVVQEVRQMLDDVEPNRYELRCGQLVSYHPDDVKNICPTSFDIGCSAEYEIISRNGQPQLKEVRSSGKVSSTAVPIGGHLHLGFCEGEDITDPLHLYDCRTLIDYFSYFTGCLHHLNRRRYEIRPVGSPVRVKTYGVEYRSPSSLWLADKELARMLFDAYYNAMDRLLSKQTFRVSDEELRRTIQNKCVSLIPARLEATPMKYQGTLPLDF
jgi:hypothetical protein